MPTGSPAITFNPGIQQGIMLNPDVLKLILQGSGTSGGAAGTSSPIFLPDEVNDGDVITAEYFNALRKAILRLAGQSGATAPGPVTLSFAPVLTPPDDTNPVTARWVQKLGFVTKPAALPATNLSTADGWMQVQLPDGYRIKNLIVTGKRLLGTTGFFGCSLQRQSLTDTALPPIVSLQIQDAAGDSPPPGTAAGTFQTRPQDPDDPANANTIVNNKNFKYFVQARLINASVDAIVQINSFQITCIPG